MAKCELDAVVNEAPQTPKTEQQEERNTCRSYSAPRLIVVGTTVELVQGTYGTYNDISGWYTYG